ncbi:nwd2 [Moniliophthora roreri]|uniref:Nephrocystin 3-like N-terminal domain-containing protein n=1 Tax=Moniliophthora roreri TaxID=221103 RepID=A0A0W0F5D4_MONRR|nr:nwd2 [Moniliophthora roreri]
MSDFDNQYELCPFPLDSGNLGSSSRMFNHTHGTSINGGTFVSVGRDQINVSMVQNGPGFRTARRILSVFTREVGAAYDSASRYPHPRCHPKTRQEIKDVILEWGRSPSNNANVFWVHGPTGVGKSAIAQTIAELAESEGLLASSFFFSRNDNKRNNARYLVPTIAYQLASRIPELNDAMTKIIQQHPGILDSAFDVQFRELLVKSYRLAVELHGQEWISHLTRRVIVIDGIDECETWQTITQQVLRYGEIKPQDLIPPIASMLAENLPFKFLLFSRPEPRIREALEAASFGPHMWQLGLGDSWDARRDIWTLLHDEFFRIRTSPRNVHVEFPHLWPAPRVIDKLVDKACGQFIYATTVLRFVDEDRSQPIKQLSIVLGLSRTAKGSSPFKDLDKLYNQILSLNPNRSEVVQILRTLLRLQGLECHRLPPNPKGVERLLGLEQGKVSAILRGMHSVLEVSSPETDIHILHESFSDFLRDRSRSGPYYIQIIPLPILLSWGCGLQRMVAGPVMFGCLWQSFIMLVPLIGILLLLIVILPPVQQPPNSTLWSAFIILDVCSVVLAGLVTLTWTIISVKLKTTCLHVRSWFVKVEVGLACIANVISIISYLILVLAYVYDPNTL